MKSLIIFPCALCLQFLLFQVALAENPLPADNAPHELAGFKLDSFIGDYDDIPSYHNFLQEIVFRDVDGFRKGSIFYGVCAEPGEIIKMQFKLKNRSEKFFKRLLKLYTKKYGKPDEYVGDTFGEIIAWKWIFHDREGNKITLVLQHNLDDPGATLGNEIKLQMPGRLRQERECYNKKFSAAGKQHKSSVSLDILSDDELIRLMVPR